MTSSTYPYGRKTMRRTPQQMRDERWKEGCDAYRREQRQAQKAPEPPPVQVIHTVETVYVEPSLDELAAVVLLGALLH